MSELIGAVKLSPSAQGVVNDLSGRLARTSFGHTISGAHITLRWRVKGGEGLRSVTMVVTSVDDGEPDPEDKDLDK